jgi:hypothetical protein
MSKPGRYIETKIALSQVLPNDLRDIVMEYTKPLDGSSWTDLDHRMYNYLIWCLSDIIDTHKTTCKNTGFSKWTLQLGNARKISDQMYGKDKEDIKLTFLLQQGSREEEWLSSDEITLK